MTEVNRWVFTICCGAVLCGAVSVLLPSRGTERLMRMVLGLFMLCCLLPAGMRLELPALDPPEAAASMEQAAGEVTEFFLQDTLERSREELRQRAVEELRESGINGQDIQIYIEAKEPKDDGRPELTAELILPRELADRGEELRQLLEKELGIAVRLG